MHPEYFLLEWGHTRGHSCPGKNCVLAAVIAISCCFAAAIEVLNITKPHVADMAGLHYVQDNPNVSASHTSEKEPIHEPDFSLLKWTPVENCKLPAPQPYYMEVGFNLVRTGAQSAALGVDSVVTWDREVPRWKYVFTIGYGAYQAAMLPCSVSLTIYRWLQLEHLQHRSFAGYECFGAMFITGPYVFDFMTTYGQYRLTQRLLVHLRAWSDGAPDLDETWRRGSGRLTEVKAMILRCMVCIYAVLVGLLAAPYMFTHIIPALVVFFPQMAYILAVGTFLSFFLGFQEVWQKVFGGDGTLGGAKLRPAAVELQRHVESLQLQIREMGEGELSAWGPSVIMAEVEVENKLRSEMEATDLAAEAAEKNAASFSFLIFKVLPVVLCVRLVVEMGFLQMSNLYAELPYITCILVVVLERQAVIYITNFWKQILLSSWACSQILLEIL